MADERVGHAGHGKVPMTVGRVGRIDHGKTSLTAAIASVLAEDEREGATVVPDRIYFDMDGVLADFDRGVAELAGFERRHGQGESREEDDLMWEAVRKVGHFYAKLEPIPGSIELFCDLHDRYGGQCEILTGIPTPKRNMPESGGDKIEWVSRFLPEDVQANVVYRREKKNFCKGPGSVLIDDFHVNVAEWERHGGTGILFEEAEDARRKLRKLGIL